MLYKMELVIILVLILLKFLNKDNELEYPYQTSWGVTTRMIGGLIMVHSDDNGLVLPPKIAPWKVIIIPIGNVDEPLKELENTLKENNITYKVDLSNKTPGFKFAEAEVKGYPLRIELGERDFKNKEVTIVRRDTLEKIKVSFKDTLDTILKLLKQMQTDMFNKALERRNKMIYSVNTYEELKDVAQKKAGFIKINWCGSEECENKIKDDTTMKTRCLIEDEEVDNCCVVCGKKAITKVYIGKQY